MAECTSIVVLSSHMTDLGDRTYPQFVFTRSDESYAQGMSLNTSAPMIRVPSRGITGWGIPDCPRAARTSLMTPGRSSRMPRWIPREGGQQRAQRGQQTALASTDIH